MDSNDSNNLPKDAPPVRLCQLFKWPDFDGFGFNLQVGHFIGKVDDDSPAQHADLREGDRIIEVNGVPISNENHKQVVQRIKAKKDETLLLVVKQNDYFWYKERDIIIKSTQPNVIRCTTPVPRPSLKQINENSKEQINGKIESTNVSLNASTNLSSQESTENKTEKIERQDNQMAEQRHNNSESKENDENEVANKLKSTKLQNESNSIENNNNSEKAANQNLVTNSVVKTSSQKSHNFIVVNSEADFAAEKRLKDEQMKNSNHTTNSTPIKISSENKIELNNHHINLSTTSSVSSSTNNLASSNNSLPNSMDINLNMSASEMRKLISSKRNVKVECKKATMDLRQKYEIIQQM